MKTYENLRTVSANNVAVLDWVFGPHRVQCIPMDDGHPRPPAPELRYLQRPQVRDDAYGKRMRIRLLIERGYTDQVIASVVGASAASVASVRGRHGL